MSKALLRIYSWWNSELSNVLQRINIVIAIVGVIISVILSGLALHLTREYGEDKSQLDQLKTIVLYQQKQNDSLGKLIISNTDLVRSSFELVKNAGLTNKYLTEQSKTLDDQLKLLTLENQANSRNQKLSKMAAVAQFAANLDSIRKLIYGRSKLHRLDLNDGDRTNLYNKLREYLTRGLNYPLLFEHHEEVRMWLEYSNEINDLAHADAQEIKVANASPRPPDYVLQEVKDNEHSLLNRTIDDATFYLFKWWDPILANEQK